MGLLYASELQDSREWVFQNAQDILDSVKNAGGWAKIFPKGVPKWLHKLRNYFNVEPKTLRLVDRSVTNHWMQDIRSFGKLSAFIKGPRTLSGDVYFDEEVEVWYQMGPGGTIYHWGRDVVVDWAEAAYAHSVRGQTGIPIFKLICPDGTGGSKETIITNPKINKVRVVGPQGVLDQMQGSSKIGATNDQILVINRVVTHMHHQGSYNFAETSVMGLKTHEKYDVNTHKKDPVYIDPPNRFEPLNKRIFNEFVINRAGGQTKKEKRDIKRDFEE